MTQYMTPFRASPHAIANALGLIRFATSKKVADHRQEADPISLSLPFRMNMFQDQIQVDVVDRNRPDRRPRTHDHFNFVAVLACDAYLDKYPVSCP